MKKISGLTGGVLGILFALWDAMVNTADTASLDQEFSISIVSWPFFIEKILIYILIGAVSGWLIGVMLEKIIRKR